jgi:ABC-type oligopeptide transport system substrate-binding subunit
MKKLLVLCIAISFFASFSLVACGPSEQTPPPAKEEAKPAPAPAPATDTAAPAPATDTAAPAAPAK